MRTARARSLRSADERLARAHHASLDREADDSSARFVAVQPGLSSSSRAIEASRIGGQI
jgi:hypothetical protein